MSRLFTMDTVPLLENLYDMEAWLHLTLSLEARNLGEGQSLADATVKAFCDTAATKSFINCGAHTTWPSLLIGADMVLTRSTALRRIYKNGRTEFWR